MAQHSRAFSLVELSIVLIILGVVIGGILPFVTNSSQQTKEDLTHSRIEHVMAALEAHVAAFGALPCPASADNSFDAADLGTSSAAAAAGGNCSSAHTSVSYSILGDNYQVANAGSVPVARLGLHPHYMLDGWGNRFTYIVDPDLTRCADYPTELASLKLFKTSSTSVIGNSVAGASGTAGTMEPWSNTVAVPCCGPGYGFGAFTQGEPSDYFDPDTQGIAVMVISHGADGGGHATAQGVVIAPSGGTLENANALQTGANFTGNFQHSTPNPGVTSTDHFDDVIRFRTKRELPTPPEICP